MGFIETLPIWVVFSASFVTLWVLWRFLFSTLRFFLRLVIIVVLALIATALLSKGEFSIKRTWDEIFRISTVEKVQWTPHGR